MSRHLLLIGLTAIVAAVVLACGRPAGSAPPKDSGGVRTEKGDDGYIRAFTPDGQTLGLFDTFNRLPKGDGYIGTNYDLRCFYFPKTGEIINTRQVEMELEHIRYVADDGRWHYISYYGLPVDSTQLLDKNLIHEYDEDKNPIFIGGTGSHAADRMR